MNLKSKYIRLTIFSFLEPIELIRVISKISKTDRATLQNSSFVTQSRPVQLTVPRQIYNYDLRYLLEFCTELFVTLNVNKVDKDNLDKLADIDLKQISLKSGTISQYEQFKGFLFNCKYIKLDKIFLKNMLYCSRKFEQAQQTSKCQTLVIRNCKRNKSDYIEMISFMNNIKNLSLSQIDHSFLRDFLHKVNLSQIETFSNINTTLPVQQPSIINQLALFAPRFDQLQILSLSFSGAFVWDSLPRLIHGLPSKNLQLFYLNIVWLRIKMHKLLKLPFNKFKVSKVYFHTLFVNCLIQGLIDSNEHVQMDTLGFDLSLLKNKQRYDRFECIKYSNKIDEMRGCFQARAKIEILDRLSGTRLKIKPQNYYLGEDEKIKSRAGYD
ncbi:UNKNOWN [Stylonychia lemnae]|uniref:Uncharacterized protein n=1 Tax=Stylonychia lemnae TaxID=5949 RepID=A0A078B4C6_STYLE|nr:UNKNOWN [Stylonychia lemnae]|eukprot:CDW89111.1 UNKNOWN [Stylonychia lemnae]